MSLSILVVDGDNFQQKAYGLFFQMKDMTWSLAATGLEAMAQVISSLKQGKTFDLIICNQELDDIQGASMLATIRRIPEYHTIPLILTSENQINFCATLPSKYSQLPPLNKKRCPLAYTQKQDRCLMSPNTMRVFKPSYQLNKPFVFDELAILLDITDSARQTANLFAAKMSYTQSR